MAVGGGGAVVEIILRISLFICSTRAADSAFFLSSSTLSFSFSFMSISRIASALVVSGTEDFIFEMEGGEEGLGLSDKLGVVAGSEVIRGLTVTFDAGERAFEEVLGGGAAGLFSALESAKDIRDLTVSLGGEFEEETASEGSSLRIEEGETSPFSFEALKGSIPGEARPTLLIL